MTSSSWIDWFWWIGGGAAAIVAFAILYWSLFHDRSRGRKRCPRCWYDMSQAPPPGLLCSECGHEAKRERKLFKTRKRWRWAMVGFILLLSACAAAITPRVQRDGWQSVIPTTALIAALPWLPETSPPVRFELLFNRPSLTFTDYLWIELRNRAQSNQLAEWQWRWLIAKCLKGDGDRQPPSMDWSLHYGEFMRRAHEHKRLGEEPYSAELAATRYRATIKTRKRWPAGVPLAVEFWLGSLWGWGMTVDGYAQAQSLFGDSLSIGHECNSHGGMLVSFTPEYLSQYRESVLIAGVPPEDARWVDFEVTLSSEKKYRQRVRVPLEVGGHISEHLTPVQSPQVIEALESIDSISLANPDTHIRIPSGAIRSVLKTLTNTTFAIRIELAKDDQIAAIGRAWWASHDDDLYVRKTGFHRGQDVRIPLQWQRLASTDTSGTWTVRIVGDPEVALWNFDCDRYWDGEVIIPFSPLSGEDAEE